MNGVWPDISIRKSCGLDNLQPQAKEVVGESSPHVHHSLQPTPLANQMRWLALSRQALQGANFTSVAQLRHGSTN